MEKIISDRKKNNLIQLQMKIKESELINIELSKIKIMDKSKKKIIKQRGIIDYKCISLNKIETRKIQELDEKEKNKKNDINIEYCLSEYDKQKFD